ncbi:hypothetical protein KA036_00335 [Candidatus Gracilibacteria bacterium]|jgi:hypothetical protein|nr:hypothetical protein [Candidatus Gracilibacteria bacterium]
METKKEIPLKTQLELLKPDDMDGTKDEFKAYQLALSALARRDTAAVQAYIEETRAKLGFEKKQTQ